VEEAAPRAPEPKPRYMMGEGEALGYFEWDPVSAKYVVALFRNGDLNTLWHESGHLVSAIMGDEWMGTLARHFDHEASPDGTVRLTDIGEEQVADAFMHYMRVRYSPNGAVQRFFQQLFWNIKEAWRVLRGKDPTLPKDVRRLWDQWLRPESTARPYAQEVTHSVMAKRHPIVNVEATAAARIEAEAVKKAGRAKSASAIDLNRQHVRSALGLKEEVYWKDISPDPAAHEWATRRRSVGGEVDAVEIMHKALAYVATEHWKKGIIGEEWVRPTLRTFVPLKRMKRIQNSIRTRVAEAIGTQPKNLKVYQKGEVVPTDVAQQFWGADNVMLTEGVVVLDAPQAAGLKTLVLELASEPLADILPKEFFDPRFAFEVVTVKQYNKIAEVLIDVEAGVASRATKYAEQISPNLAFAFVNGIKTAANHVISKSKRLEEMKLNFKDRFVVPKFGDDDYIAPVVRDLTEAGVRELNGIDRWILQMADLAVGVDDATSYQAVYRSMIGKLNAPVNPGQTSQLFEMVDRFSGVLEADARRLGRMERGEIHSGDEVMQLTHMELYSRLDAIQGLLHNGKGLTDHERAALRILRTYERTPLEDLADGDLYALGDAVREIHHGLWSRKELVKQRAREILMSLEGTTDKSILIERHDIEYQMLYQWFYKGDFKSMFDWAAGEGRAVGADPTAIPEYSQAVATLEMIARMRANEIIGNLSRNLAEYGVTMDARKLTRHQKFGPGTSLDRDGFVDRVAYYLNKEMTWGASMQRVKETGEIHKKPAAPPRSMYAIHDMPDDGGPGRWGVGWRDQIAYTRAHDLLAEWGFKLGKGKWERHVMPDGSEALVPLMLTKEIEDAVDRAASIGQAWTRGRTRTIKSQRTNVALDQPTKQRPKTFIQMKLGQAVDTLMDLNPVTASRIKMGVTTGIGMPNSAYYAGVTLGAFFQAYQTQGAFAATKYLVKAPVSAFRTYSAIDLAHFGVRPDMVGSVVARMWKEGGYTPHSAALFTKNGMIYTDDMVAHLAIREGMKSSYIQAETTQALAKDLEDKMPKFMGWMRRFPKWWQGNLVEVATAVDNYFRVSIFVDELAKGRSPSAAAEISRKAGFDYSALTEFERKKLRWFVMFYSYQRKNLDLFWDTMLRNPHRIIAQMRLVRGSQRMVLDPEDPEVILDDYLKSRMMVSLKDAYWTGNYNRQLAFVAPILPFEDVLNVVTDLGQAPFLMHSERGQEGARGLVSRFTPWVQFPFVMAGEKDFFYGYDLKRNNVVPGWFIELDFNLTGGQLYQLLEIQKVPVKNKVYEDVPGRDQFKAMNGEAWWFFRNMLQTPGFGRSMHTITAMDRANLGPVETLVELSALFREHARHPLEDAGWLDVPTSEPAIPVGLSKDDWRRDTMLPRPDFYEGDPTDFSFLEFAGLMGVKGRYVDTYESRVAEMLKHARYEIERETKEKETPDTD